MAMSDALARIGIDVGRKLPLEEAVAWARANGVAHIDIQLDTGANAFTRLDASRARAVRAAAEAGGVRIALHTSSAVNIGEYAPLLDEATDAYLRAYIDASALLGAEWIVAHAGYHFTSDKDERMRAGLDRLRRVLPYAEAKGARLLLENLNKEPADAEVKYLAHTLAEWRWYYEQLDSPAFGLSFTANHAHLVEEGVAGFLAAIPLALVAEVRLADCHRLGVEEHLCPGEGDFDFPGLFQALKVAGYRGVFTNAFGSLDDMLAGRRLFAGMMG